MTPIFLKNPLSKTILLKPTFSVKKKRRVLMNKKRLKTH
jgi:hypothetical protein